MWCQNKHYFDHRFCCCRKCPYPSEFSQLFGFECTPNKRFEPLCSSVNTNCTGHTHRQTESHTFPSVSLFLKGLPPKQPEGFGCFVCPNSQNVQARGLEAACKVLQNVSGGRKGQDAPHAMAPIQLARTNPEYLRDWSPVAL